MKANITYEKNKAVGLATVLVLEMMVCLSRRIWRDEAGRDERKGKEHGDEER